MSRSILTAALAAFVVCLSSLSAQAQGLIWKLPPVGHWVKYEGTFKQYETQFDSGDGEPLTWSRHMWIKSLDAEQAEFKGRTVECRWVEIKIQTGGTSAAGVDTGRVGERIYKVLIPEESVIGHWRDSENIPVEYLPIVKGYRKISDVDATPKVITTPMLQVFPMVSLVRHYKDMTRSETPENVKIGTGNGPKDLPCTKLTGSIQQESKTRRILHETTLFRSDDDDVPFGLAKWTVKITQDEKGSVEPRTEFENATEITVEMTAQDSGVDATSDLVIEAGM
jgi:hypothetical protein